MRVVTKDNATGLVETGGMEYEVSFALLPDAKVGDYVIVHTGFAIQKLDRRDAEETLELFEEIRLEDARIEGLRQTGPGNGNPDAAGPGKTR